MPQASVPDTLFRREDDLAALPASERIRYRLIGADCRFHANDNISAHVLPGELDELEHTNPWQIPALTPETERIAGELALGSGSAADPDPEQGGDEGD